jgi:tetratricopeptide (TPR) repeat protein
MVLKNLRSWVLLLTLCFSSLVLSHADLEIQIERLSVELLQEPRNTELLLKRGDLYRRHADWSASEQDFKTLRSISADHPLVDLVEGRLLLDSGKLEEGRVMLSRFIESSPGRADAYLSRAATHWGLNLPLEAAKDFQAAINLSERPSPGLYRALIISLVNAGPEQSESAMTAVTASLNRHSREITLLGLAVDLVLSQGDVKLALSYLTRVPERVNELPQWQFRRSLWACLNQDDEEATLGFSSLVALSRDGSNAGKDTWRIPQETVLGLSRKPEHDLCLAAAWQNILELDP